MPNSLTLEMPSIPPAELRGNSTAHWAEKRRASAIMADEAVALLSGTTWRPQRIKFTFAFHHHRKVDFDNLGIGMKAFVDSAVVMLGMPNDDPDHVSYGEPSFTKCAKGQSKTIIIIEEQN